VKPSCPKWGPVGGAALLFQGIEEGGPSPTFKRIWTWGDGRVDSTSGHRPGHGGPKKPPKANMHARESGVSSHVCEAGYAHWQGRVPEARAVISEPPTARPAGQPMDGGQRIIGRLVRLFPGIWEGLTASSVEESNWKIGLSGCFFVPEGEDLETERNCVGMGDYMDLGWKSMGLR
jgi:hypothetical protein